MVWRDLLLRLRALFRRSDVERELEEELNFHLEMEARKNLAAGTPAAQATQSARVNFGGVEQIREECRDARRVSLLENAIRDIRYGTRVLLRAPVFTAIGVLSLAIGIGANTAVFTLLDTILLRMLPVREPENLVIARWGSRKDLPVSTTWANGSSDGQGGWTRDVVSWSIFSAMRERSRTLDSVIGFSPLGQANVAFGGQALSTGAMVVSGNYFQTLGVGTILGRPITADDDTSDGLPSAVISYRFWERVYGSDPSAIGKTLYVNGIPCSVIGVTPKGFFGVSPGGFTRTPDIDISLPIRSRERMPPAGDRAAYFNGDLFWVKVMGRTKPTVAQTAVKSELAAIFAANLPEEARLALGTESPRITLDPGGQGLDGLRTAYRKPLWILMSVVGMTLLMACANLAGLLLARATARKREMQLRLAIGASRWRLVRQLVIEGVLLSTAGAALGVALAFWGLRALLALMATGPAPIPLTVSPDARVLAFTAAVSILTTFLFALAPALRATRVDMAVALKEDSPSAPGTLGVSTGRLLLASQVAVALVLLAGATLFAKSLAHLRSLPLGFAAENLILFDLAPGKNGYDEARANQIYSQVTERLRRTPGVTGVSLVSQRLIGGFTSDGSIQLAGNRAQSTFNFVGPDFFDVMKIPVVLGRGIEQRDLAATPRVAVINETLARKLSLIGTPIGRRFSWPFKKDWDVEIVGIVKDAKYSRLKGDAPATLYVPYTQRPFGWPEEMSFAVRTAVNPRDAASRIRTIVAEVDRMLPLTEFKTQEAQIDDSLAKERLFASLIGLFSAITLLLACVGLYGSVAYSVTRRTREIGIRMALGARGPVVLRMLVAHAGASIAAGLLMGLAATWGLTRFIESQLYGLDGHDPASLLSACACVMLVALLAAYIPARRATRIDPLQALRYE